MGRRTGGTGSSHIETITGDDIPRFRQAGRDRQLSTAPRLPEDDTLLVWARNVGPERCSAPGRGGASKRPEACWPLAATGRS